MAKIVVPYQKTDFRAKNRKFWAKKNSLLSPNHVPATTTKSYNYRKVAFSQIINRDEPIGGCLYSEKRIFGRFSTFQQNANAAVSPYFRLGLAAHSNQIIFLVILTIRPSFIKFGPKLGVLPLVKWESPKMAIFRPRGHEKGHNLETKSRKLFPKVPK